MNKTDLPPLTLIAGPTVSGKSALALKLASERPSVIVNADAMQVYADLRVLTARPSAADEAAAPHRLFGHIDGAVPCSAADWAAEAKVVLAEAWAAGLHPILVGGTGLYIRTLLDGIAPVPAIDPVIRDAARALPVAAAHAALTAEDPLMAARLNPADTARVARALEVVRATGRSLTEWQRVKQGGIGKDVALHPIILDPPRHTLIERSDARIERMLADGALTEVSRIETRQLDIGLPVMRAIGVRPLLAHLDGKMTIVEAQAQIRRDTNAYIKRQQTWLRGQVSSNWHRVPYPDG